MAVRLRVAAILSFAALAAAGCSAGNVAPSAPAVSSGPQWRYAGGVLYHVPHYALSRSAQAKIRPALAYVPYLGGPVIITPKFYFVYWDYKKVGDPDRVEQLLTQYAKVMGGSGHNNIEIQYYEGSNSKTYITNPANQFGGAWNDDSAIPKSPTDAQVAAESVKAVEHFGYDPNGIYVVATAHNHSESQFGTNWCSYHSFTYYKKKPVPYANIPYVPDAGKNCGANIISPPSDEAGTDEGVTIMAGHEFGEAITDPQPFSAWNGPSGEIADYCAWHNMANDPFGSKSYTEQPMVSDATESCVQSYSTSP